MGVVLGVYEGRVGWERHVKWMKTCEKTVCLLCHEVPLERKCCRQTHYLFWTTAIIWFYVSTHIKDSHTHQVNTTIVGLR